MSESDDSSYPMRTRCSVLPSGSISEEPLSGSETEEEDNRPQSSTRIGKIFTHKSHPPLYFCKLAGRSYRDSVWLPEYELKGTSLLRRYLSSHSGPPTPPFYDPQFDVPERIVGTRANGEYLVKWTNLDLDEATWETSVPSDLITQFIARNRLPPIEFRFPPPRPSPSEWKVITSHPPSKTKGLEVRSYQLEGLNFLVNAWYNQRNAILTDEMGLGKTAQACLFLDHIYTQRRVHGPFLIVGPLSTIPHWEREIADWTTLPTITYVGSRARRSILEAYDFFFPDSKIPKFDILLTTYEFVLKSANVLQTIHWRVVVVDEAHRLKSQSSKLLQAMKGFKCDFKLLLSGTPLQNNTEEL
jgi:chromodomain-helicase-DNA-binding protein 7